VEAARDGTPAQLDVTGPPALRPFLVAALATRAQRPVLAVTATGREAEDLAAALLDRLPPTGRFTTPSSVSGRRRLATCAPCSVSSVPVLVTASSGERTPVNDEPGYGVVSALLGHRVASA
jgi:hypothetical protein